MASDDQVKMNAPRCLVGGVNHFSILDYGNAGGAAANIHHRSVLNVKHQRRRGGFIDQSHNVQLCSLQDIAKGLCVSPRGTGRIGRRGDRDGKTGFPDDPYLVTQDGDGADVIQYQPVANAGLTAGQSPGHRPAQNVDDGGNRIGCSQIDSRKQGAVARSFAIECQGRGKC